MLLKFRTVCSSQTVIKICKLLSFGPFFKVYHAKMRELRVIKVAHWQQQNEKLPFSVAKETQSFMSLVAKSRCLWDVNETVQKSY